MRLNQYIIAALVYAGCIPAAHTKGISDLVVYIECTQEGKPVSRGSGVLVSEKGHVLTAGHVVPQGYECKGVPGNPTRPARGLIKDPRSMQGVDAILLRFIPDEGEKFPSAKFCKLDDALQGESIKVRGFNSGSKKLTIRQGVISTINMDERGVIETDVHLVGMSGSPAMLGDGSNLIGIALGMQLDPVTGNPMYYGVLAAEVIANTFQLAEASSPCGEQNTPPPEQAKPSEPKPDAATVINQKIEGNSGIAIQAGGNATNININHPGK